MLDRVCEGASRIEVSASLRAFPEDIAGLAGPLRICDPAPERKLHPALRENRTDTLVTPDADGKPSNYARNADGTLNLVVYLYPGAARGEFEAELRADGILREDTVLTVAGNDAVLLRARPATLRITTARVTASSS